MNTRALPTVSSSPNVAKRGLSREHDAVADKLRDCPLWERFRCGENLHARLAEHVDRNGTLNLDRGEAVEAAHTYDMRSKLLVPASASICWKTGRFRVYERPRGSEYGSVMVCPSHAAQERMSLS
jgi:hypothetical protein